MKRQERQMKIVHKMWIGREKKIVQQRKIDHFQLN